MWEIYRSVVNTHFLNQFSEEEVARFSDALNNAMQLARSDQASGVMCRTRSASAISAEGFSARRPAV